MTEMSRLLRSCVIKYDAVCSIKNRKEAIAKDIGVLLAVEAMLADGVILSQEALYYGSILRGIVYRGVGK